MLDYRVMFKMFLRKLKYQKGNLKSKMLFGRHLYNYILTYTIHQ